MSSELEIKASYEAALLVGGRVGWGVLSCAAESIFLLNPEDWKSTILHMLLYQTIFMVVYLPASKGQPGVKSSGPLRDPSHWLEAGKL